MPYRLDWEPVGVYRQFLGDVSIAERRDSVNAISGDPRFDTLRYTLTDYLGIGAFEATPGSTAEIAAMHVGPCITNPRILIAAVTDREDVLATIDDFKRLAFISSPYEVFRTLEAARAWIGEELARPVRRWAW